MSRSTDIILRLTASQHEQLKRHLFPGDGKESVALALCGTHRGDQLGFPATGKSVTFQGIIVDRLRDGKIVDRHEIADALGLFQQLGVVPAPGQSG